MTTKRDPFEYAFGRNILLDAIFRTTPRTSRDGVFLLFRTIVGKTITGRVRNPDTTLGQATAVGPIRDSKIAAHEYKISFLQPILDSIEADTLKAKQETIRLVMDNVITTKEDVEYKIIFGEKIRQTLLNALYPLPYRCKRVSWVVLVLWFLVVLCSSVDLLASLWLPSSSIFRLLGSLAIALGLLFGCFGHFLVELVPLG